MFVDQSVVLSIGVCKTSMIFIDVFDASMIFSLSLSIDKTPAMIIADSTSLVYVSVCVCVCVCVSVC